MARNVDMAKKAEELKAIILKYNGIPSQKVDKAAYANVSYYIKRHADKPEIKALIEQFNLRVMTHDNFELRFSEVKAILEENGRMPSSSKENTQYQYIKQFFKRNQDNPEVVKLKYIYAARDCFPLPNTKFGKNPAGEWIPGEKPGKEWQEWIRNVVYEYIEYVFENYGILPAKNTKPMVEFKKQVSSFQRYNVDINKKQGNQFHDFLSLMVKKGCKDPLITQNYACYQFGDDSVQQRIRSMLIENGACAIHYISNMAILGTVLPEKYVYFYYYVRHHDKPNLIEFGPVGDFYAFPDSYSNQLLFVHYRDAKYCDINSIKRNAMKYDRDWEENPPQSLEEWQAFGQWNFFQHEILYNREIKDYQYIRDWTKTVVQNALDKGVPYFRYYNVEKYLDYILYLFENNHLPQTNWLQGKIKYILTYVQSDEVVESMRLKVRRLLNNKGMLKWIEDK